MPSLLQAVEAIKRAPLTSDEVAMLQEFQRQFDLDDEDPLNVVLAMMARSQMILEAVPILLQQKANETIELHRITLQDQARLTAKDLIAHIAEMLLGQIKGTSLSWRQRLFWFTSGAVTMLGVMVCAVLVVRSIH